MVICFLPNIILYILADFYHFGHISHCKKSPLTAQKQLCKYKQYYNVLYRKKRRLTQTSSLWSYLPITHDNFQKSWIFYLTEELMPVYLFVVVVITDICLPHIDLPKVLCQLLFMTQSLLFSRASDRYCEGLGQRGLTSGSETLGLAIFLTMPWPRPLGNLSNP